MRLLRCNIGGEASLTEFPDDSPPPYAILSHTWGREEVTFKDMIDGRGKNKLGYNKIQFCEQQASRDGLQYIWIDTCCIDKTSSAELQEAINRMFQWYQRAAKCYAYLADVSTKKRKPSDSSARYSWESAFRESRWFTRGWTLQELIAPASVEFFSADRVRLGDKISLEKQIRDVTEIPSDALQGRSLSEFSINERLAWMERRNTTVQEDKAYSLFGIFDVQMPLLYGEGEKKAFARLHEELNKTRKCESSLYSLMPRPLAE